MSSVFGSMNGVESGSRAGQASRHFVEKERLVHHPTALSAVTKSPSRAHIGPESSSILQRAEAEGGFRLLPSHGSNSQPCVSPASRTDKRTYSGKQRKIIIYRIMSEETSNNSAKKNDQ
jgi:hypothetical protein